MGRYDYNFNKGADKVFEAAAALAKFVIASDFEMPMKKRLLSRVQWIATEVHGKYNCRYVSEGARKAIGRGEHKILQHEHVYRKKDVSLDLLEMKSLKDISEMLSRLRGCVVTKEEHARLGKVDQSKVRNGWQRYIDAKVGVYDRKLKRPKALYAGRLAKPAKRRPK